MNEIIHLPYERTSDLDIPSDRLADDAAIQPINDVESCLPIKSPKELGRATLRSFLVTLKDGTQYFTDYAQLPESARKTDALVVSTTAFGTTHAGMFLQETDRIADMGAESVVVSVPLNGAPDIMKNAYAMDAITRHLRGEPGRTISRGYSRASIHGIGYASIAQDEVVHAEWDHLVFPDKRNPFNKIRRHLARFALTEMTASLAFLGQSPHDTLTALRSAEMSPHRIYRNTREIFTLTNGTVRTAVDALPSDMTFNIRAAADDGMGYAKTWQEIFSNDKFPNGNITIYPNGGHSSYFRHSRHIERMNAMGDAIDAHPN